MFFNIVLLIGAFISLILYFSNNTKIFIWKNNKFIKSHNKKLYIKTTKKLLLLQSILFIISAIANYNNYRTLMRVVLYAITIVGCCPTVLMLRRNKKI